VVVLENCDVEGKVVFVWLDTGVFYNIKLIEVGVDVFTETVNFVGRVESGSVEMEFLEEESSCLGEFDVFLIYISEDGFTCDNGEYIVDSVGVVVLESRWRDSENSRKFQQVFCCVENLGSIIGGGRLIAGTARVM
jgi:hypothetical protein